MNFVKNRLIDFNTSSKGFSKLSENHFIGPTELKIWPFKDNTRSPSFRKGYTCTVLATISFTQTVWIDLLVLLDYLWLCLEYLGHGQEAQILEVLITILNEQSQLGHT